MGKTIKLSSADEPMANYRLSVSEFEFVLDTTLQLSLIQHGIKADGRGVRASRVFVRQAVIGMSLARLLPFSHVGPVDFWDVCSVASLTRNLMEGYVMLFYAGTQAVGVEEAELRFFLQQYHRNREWHEISKVQPLGRANVAEVEEGLASELRRIKDHPYLPKLTLDQQKRVKAGAEIYFTKGDIERLVPRAVKYRQCHRLLSNLVHASPLSIERIDDDRGRGDRSEADMAHFLLCITLATHYLGATTLAFADHFPELATRLAEPLTQVRLYVAASELRADAPPS